MIARKLSNLVCCAIFLIVGGIAPIATNNLHAEDQVKVATPANVIDNPFASAAQHKQSRSPATPEEPLPSSRRPITYQNPFAAMSKGPPVETSLRPGPVSRWRHPTFRADQVSPIKSAMISAQPDKTERATWDQLPPAEALRHNTASRLPETDPGFYSRLVALPLPIQLAPTPLAQPAWIAGDSDDARSQSFISPHVGQTIFDGPLKATDKVIQASASSIGPEAVSRGDISNAFAISPHGMAVAKTDIPAAIASNCVNSPDGWLDEAQHAAKKANSPEELSAVIELCNRGLRTCAEDKISSSLRRLAAWAHNRRGELWADADRGDDALNDFQAAIALDPKCSLAIHNRAVTFAQRREFDAALRDFNRVIELNPGLAVAYRNRAELLSALGRMKEAVADYTEAIEGLPNDADIYCGRAYAYQRLGDSSKARADFDRAIELVPNDADALTQRGNLLAEQGDFDKALTDFRRALANDPKWTEAHRSLAWIEATCPDARFQNPQEALAEAQEAVKLAPANDYLMLDTLAAAYANAGQLDTAVETQQKAVKNAPPDLVASLRQRLERYQHGRAYRDVLPFRKSDAQSDKVQ